MIILLWALALAANLASTVICITLNNKPLAILPALMTAVSFWQLFILTGTH